MNGDPFAAAKLIYDGVRRWWESVVAEEKRQYECVQNSVREPALVLHADDDCPECHTHASMREIAGAGTRCFQCGFQPKVYGVPGSVSRKDLESWQGYSPEHKAAFRRGFGNARARFPRK